MAFAQWLVNFKRSLPIALVLIALAIGIAAGAGAKDPTRAVDDTLPAGAHSTQVAVALDTFDTEDTTVVPAVVLWTAREGTLSEVQLAALQEQQLTAGPVQIAEDKTAAFGVVPLQADAGELGDKVKELRKTVTEQAGTGVTAQVTGPAGIQADIGAVFEGADFRLLFATATVVALLLLITYRSPTLWLIPLLVVGLADRLAVTVATHGLAAVKVPFDESTTGILSVLVFGAGTNYALLLISRYRDELKTHSDRFVAMQRAVRYAGEAVLASAATVVVGVVTLLLSAFPTTRGLGLASAIGIAVAAGFVMIVLPCVLVYFGRWVFWPKTPRVGQTQLVDGTSLWHKVGTVVARRPKIAAAGTIALLIGLSSGVVGINTGLAAKDQFLDTPEAITASDRLAQSFPAGATDPVTILTTADPQKVVQDVTKTTGVASAIVLPKALGPYYQINAVLRDASGTQEARDTIGAIRAITAQHAKTLVGGTEATLIDQKAAANHDLKVMVPLIVLFVTVILGLLLRSVVAPVILVATVMGTYGAALGVSWLVFEHIFGFDAIGASVPLYAFLFLVALGVDYNIFLVTRVAEERDHHGVRRSVVRGLAATGGVITSAGILLAAVFAVLGVLPLVVLAQLGVIICVGVLLDTLLVRTVVVPAIAVALGNKFWWPRRFAGGQTASVELAPEEQPVGH